MTQLSTFGGVVVPSPTESATIPADFLAVVNQFTGTATNPARANAVVSSQAERDSNYAGYPAGGIVVCPPAKTIWMSLGRISGVQSWQIVYEDTGWVTDGFTFSDNFGAAGTETRVRRITDYVCLRAGVTYNGDNDIVGGSVTSSNPGNIVDTTRAHPPCQTTSNPAAYKTRSSAPPSPQVPRSSTLPAWRTSLTCTPARKFRPGRASPCSSLGWLTADGRRPLRRRPRIGSD